MSNSTPNNAGTIAHLSGTSALVAVVSEALAQVPQDIIDTADEHIARTYITAKDLDKAAIFPDTGDLADFNASEAASVEDTAPVAKKPKHAGDFGRPWSEMTERERNIRRKEMRAKSLRGA